MKRKREKEQMMMGSADLLLQLRRIAATMESADELASVLQDMAAALRQTSSQPDDDGAAAAEEEEDLARQFLDKGLLALLPSLLQHSCVDVAIASAEIVGALAVSSCEINARVAKERALLEALTELLLLPSRRTRTRTRTDAAECCLAACHAIMDVAITPLGCSAVREVPGLQQHLMSLVCSLANILTGGLPSLPFPGVTEAKPIAECFAEADEEEHRLAIEGSKKDHHHQKSSPFVSSLTVSSDDDDDAVATAGEVLEQVLVVANTVLLLDNNTEPDFDTMDALLLSLQKLWKTTQPSPSPSVLLHGSRKRTSTTESRRQLAKLIVQLALQQRVGGASGDVLTRTPCLFLGGREEGIRWDRFLQEHWESSPVVVTDLLGNGIHRTSREWLAELFGNHGICVDSPAEFLKMVVRGMVGCPLAFADEVDPRIQYEGLETGLGEPPVYDQDIRLVKSEPSASSSPSLEEVHCFREKERTSVSADDCVSAYRDGYTVVIRGMQFRFPAIAALADALAARLGQVTVGANLYLTPPRSQGLVAHFDDHCVFVCQLVGRKEWKVCAPPQQHTRLPRLYTFEALSEDARKDNPVAHRYSLCAGDVLYIPRGFPHEAHTSCCSSSEEKPSLDSSQNVGSEEKPSLDSSQNVGTELRNWAGVSLHLSLGVEVEPAFEWEGLLHIALRLWSHHRRQQSTYFTGDNKTEDLCEALLHVSIRNIGNKTITFRKARVPLSSTADLGSAPLEDNCSHCSYCSHCSHSVVLMEEAGFVRMLKEVGEGADYREALKEYDEGRSLSWLSWLNQLSVCGLQQQQQLNCHADELSAGSVEEEVFPVEEEAFRQMADAFVQEAAFQASVQEQRNLLTVFRTCRRKLTNAMLALHTYH